MRRRRRRNGWKAPNNPTAAAKQVWRHVYPLEPWPKGWKVEWVGFMRNVHGLTLYGRKVILLSYADAKKKHADPVELLCHEFVHMRCGHKLRHGKDFSRLEGAAVHRLYQPADESYCTTTTAGAQ